jgi:hypothetical protein
MMSEDYLDKILAAKPPADRGVTMQHHECLQPHRLPKSTQQVIFCGEQGSDWRGLAHLV